MLIGYKRGQTSVVLRVKILDSSVTTGAGKTGLSSSSSGLIISTIADNESAATAYTAAGSTIESITTLGTYATPTATKCRFKEVDATNHKGVYEIQIADARFNVSSSKSLLVSIVGASNAAETDVVIPLRDLDPYDSIRAGLTALPNAAAGASTGLPLAVDSSGRVDVLKINGTSQTARDLGASVLLSSGTDTGQLDFTSGVVKANTTQWLGGTIPAVNVTGVPLVDAKYLMGTALTDTSGRLAAGFSTYFNIASPTSTMNLITACTTVTTTTTATNVTTVNGLAAGVITAASIAADAITDAKVASDVTIASVTGAVGSVTGAVGSVTGNVGGNVTGSVGSVTGNVGGNVVGSVGSVTAAVSLSAADTPSLATGTATAGAATTITLQTALGADSLPVGSLLKITSGTGTKQTRVITGYVDATKVVTVDRAWVTNPDNTSVYAILYNESPKLDSSLKISGVVLADTLTTYTGNTVQTGDSYGRIGATGSGLTSLAQASIWTSTVAGHIDADVSSRMATYTQPTGFLAATFPSSVGTSTLTQAQVTGGAYTVQSSSCVLGDARLAHLDADISGRMATYTQPTGFLAATFPATVASPTNITAGTLTTVTTVTNLTNAPTAGDFTATMKTSIGTAVAASAVASVTGAVGSVAGDVGGNVIGSVGSVSGVTFPAHFDALGITAGGHVTNVDTLTTYTGNTPQTGDVYARVGATGSGLTSLAQSSVWTSTLATNLTTLAGHDPGTTLGTSTLTQAQVTGGAYTVQSAGCVLGDGRLAHLDGDVSSRMATYAQPTGFLAATFPSGTVANTTNITAGTVTNLTNLPALTTDWITAAGVSAAAVTKIQSGLSTYGGGDTSGTTTLLGRLSATRAGLLDNLDAAVSSRTKPADTQAAVTLVTTTTNLTNAPTGVALASQIPAHFTNATFVSDGVLAAAALANAPTGGGGGTTDWTDTERQQIRQALGVTGTATATTGTGVLDGVAGKLLGAGTAVTVSTGGTADGGRVIITRNSDMVAAIGTALEVTLTTGLTVTAATLRVHTGSHTSSSLAFDPVAAAITTVPGGYHCSVDLDRTYTRLLAVGSECLYVWRVTYAGGYEVDVIEGIAEIHE